MAMVDRTTGLKESITTNVTRPSPIICFDGMLVSDVACGENHSLALISQPELGKDYKLWSWGDHKKAQLGIGEVLKKDNPRPVQYFHDAHIYRMAAGS